MSSQGPLVPDLVPERITIESIKCDKKRASYVNLEPGTLYHYDACACIRMYQKQVTQMNFRERDKLWTIIARGRFIRTKSSRTSVTTHPLYREAQKTDFDPESLTWSSYIILYALYGTRLPTVYVNHIEKKFGTVEIRDFSYEYFEHYPDEEGRYDVDLSTMATSIDSSNNNTPTAADGLFDAQDQAENDEEQDLVTPKRLKTTHQGPFALPAPSAPSALKSHHSQLRAETTTQAATNAPKHDFFRPQTPKKGPETPQMGGLDRTFFDITTPISPTLKRKRHATDSQAPKTKVSEVTSSKVTTAEPPSTSRQHQATDLQALKTKVSEVTSSKVTTAEPPSTNRQHQATDSQAPKTKVSEVTSSKVTTAEPPSTNRQHQATDSQAPKTKVPEVTSNTVTPVVAPSSTIDVAGLVSQMESAAPKQQAPIDAGTAFLERAFTKRQLQRVETLEKNYQTLLSKADTIITCLETLTQTIVNHDKVVEGNQKEYTKHMTDVNTVLVEMVKRMKIEN